MADDGDIEISIVLDDGSIKKGFAKVEKGAKKSSKKVGKSFQSSFSSFGKTLAVSAAAAAAAVAGIALALRPAVAAALEAESALTKFNLTMSNAGTFSTAASSRFAGFANQLQSQTGISNDLITSNASLLVSIGKLSGDGLERATAAAVNLSKGLDIDLRTSFDLVSKAASGNASLLNRYGIKVDTSASKSVQFADALGQIEGKFDGLAESLSNSTFEGGLGKAEASFGEIQKAVGKFVTESPLIRKSILLIAKAFQDVADSINDSNVGDKVGDIILQILDLGLAINKFVIAPIELVGKLFVFAFRSIAFAINGTIALFANFGQALFDNVQKPIIDFFSEKLGSVVGVVDKKLGAKLTALGKGYGDNVSEGLNIAAQSTRDVFFTQLDELARDADTAFNSTMSDSMREFVLKYKNRIKELKLATLDLGKTNDDVGKDATTSWITAGKSFSSFSLGFQEKGDEFQKNAIKNFKAVGAAARTSLGTGLGQAFAAAGAAFAKGENALEAFGKIMLGIFGDIAIQLGTQFILQGIGWSVNPPTWGSGLPLVAAGAALAAFGGALKASVGGGGIAASPSPAQATGGTAPGGGLTSSPDDFGNVAITDFDTQPATMIELNIQGDVLDSSATGLRIVELINSAFDEQGVTVTA